MYIMTAKGWKTLQGKSLPSEKKLVEVPQSVVDFTLYVKKKFETREDELKHFASNVLRAKSTTYRPNSRDDLTSLAKELAKEGRCLPSR